MTMNILFILTIKPFGEAIKVITYPKNMWLYLENNVVFNYNMVVEI